MITPILNGIRQKYKDKDVRVIDGDICIRKRGLNAIVEINGKKYKWYGRACGLPNCFCD